MVCGCCGWLKVEVVWNKQVDASHSGCYDVMNAALSGGDGGVEYVRVRVPSSYLNKMKVEQQ